MFWCGKRDSQGGAKALRQEGMTGSEELGQAGQNVSHLKLALLLKW